ncbi:lipopolysaccharide-induced tumor necrosis factor-alpha factor homolog [Drosophila tropicalis]|uniref:lipopolysaccharide-induced tumor necrosis factor-alpha factor homolog n=1 Tax=Drosophila tropicalis TaxID=46794 RepID=UPI0035AC0739
MEKSCYSLAPISAPPAQPPVLVINSNALLGPVPQRMQCKYCQMIMETCIKKRVTRYTHFFALAFCLTGLLCLVPLPYCLKSCQSLDHYCTSCNQFLGKAAN